MSLDEAREAYQSFHCCRMAGGRIPRDVSIAYQEAVAVFENHEIDPDEDAAEF